MGANVNLPGSRGIQSASLSSLTNSRVPPVVDWPQVVPALDPSTPIYASGFAMELIKRRLQEFNLWDEGRFRTFSMRERFELGPFE